LENIHYGSGFVWISPQGYQKRQKHSSSASWNRRWNKMVTLPASFYAIAYTSQPMSVSKNPTALFSRMILFVVLLSVVLLSEAVQADTIPEPASPGDAPPPNSPSISLAQLAAEADVVALVQMRDGDYRYQREFPVSGSAHLRVLIPYKTDQPLEMIEVYETGLHPNECYFPNPSMLEEGRRYLVFLRRDPDDEKRYRGLPMGCALDVLVEADNAYALRLPVTGIELSDDLRAYAKPMKFADPYAHESEELMDSVQREAWLNEGWLKREMTEQGKELIYTQGVRLSEIRNLLGPEGVSLDRHQKRLPQEP